LADLLLAAATDWRYYGDGHVADFVNKACEALDAAGWQMAGPVLASLANFLATAARSEESNSWRHPVDLVAQEQAAFEQLPAALAQGQGQSWDDGPALVATVLDGEPADLIEALLAALRGGCAMVELASLVSQAAAWRVARFHVSNEFGDWDTALHTLTFANAVEQGLRRAPSVELLRGVFDAAVSVYLDRFLNIPAARLPEPEPGGDPAAILAELPSLLDGQMQVQAAAELTARFLAAGGSPRRLLAALGHGLLREDRDFHTIQMIEAASRQHQHLAGTPAERVALIAAARYLAAHCPTRRAQEQTYRTAERLHRGERLFQDD
jgi:hypothetical protein